MSDQREIYERDREDPYYEGRHTHRKEGFFERNCDEAWEQVKETFSHPGRLFAKVLLIALLCGVVAGGSYLLKIRAPELPGKDTDSKNNNSEQIDDIDYGDGVRPKAGGERKSKDFYTVLILGRDTGGGGNTDTMLLASYDVTNQKATVMSIPRDTMVNVPWDIKRINSVYNYYGGGEKGIKALYKEIAQLVGFEPDYQVVVEWDAVGEIVKAMGGVYYDVPRNMNYDDPYQDLSIHFKEGMQHLNGKQAMEVARFRKNNANSSGTSTGYSDVGRTQTQQQLLLALAKKVLSWNSISRVNGFVNIFNEYVDTDLSLKDMAYFAAQAVNVDLASAETTTLDGRGDAVYHGKRYCFELDQEKTLETVNRLINPYTRDLTLADMHLMKAERYMG